MRLGDLLGREVVDASGRRIGRVHDVGLVQDGPLVPGFGHALRVDSLVVGRWAWAVRLGYARHGLKGPFLLTWPLRAFEGRARRVPWADVADADGDVIRLARDAGELASIAAP